MIMENDRICSIDSCPHSGWPHIRSFPFLDQSFAETKRLNFGLSPVLRLTNHRSASSLMSSAAHR